MSIEQAIGLVFLFYVGYLIGYGMGRRAGSATIYNRLVNAYSNSLHAMNYWQDRGLLAEQKLQMVTVKSTAFVAVESLPKWRAAVTEIMQADGSVSHG